MDIKKKHSFFFAGAGWGAGYYIGVYKALLEKYREQLYDKNTKYGGYSAGALVCLSILLKIDPKFMINKFRKLNNLGVNKNVSASETFERLLNYVLDDLPNDVSFLNGKFYVFYTRFPKKCIKISKWKSKKHIKECLIYSSSIPFFVNYNKKNYIYSDGGFSIKYFRFNKNTIVIGIGGDKTYDIYSSKYLNTHFLKPMQKNDFEKLYLEGYQNTIHFLKKRKNKVIKNTKSNIKLYKPKLTQKELALYYLLFIIEKLLEEKIFKFLTLSLIILKIYKRKNIFYLFKLCRNNFLGYKSIKNL